MRSSSQPWACVCLHVALVSQCNSWWISPSTPCVKLLEAHHIGTFPCWEPWTTFSDLDLGLICVMDGCKTNVLLSTVLYIFSWLWGTSSSSSMMSFQHITSKVFWGFLFLALCWMVLRGQIKPAPECLNIFLGKICSSSHIWQLYSTTTACTWRITCSLWATISKLTCHSPTARASPRLSTWCQDSGG